MSEKIIWEKLRSGDIKALEEIYKIYFTDLIRYGRRFTINESLVEDCVQELFVALWERRNQLSTTDAIKPYLLVALRRNIIHVLKKQQKNISEEVSEIHFDAELAIDQKIINEEDNNQQKEKLETALNQLSERQKEVLYLKYNLELSYDEISSIMDLNYQSARNLVSRALIKLSKIILSLIFILLK